MTRIQGHQGGTLNGKDKRIAFLDAKFHVEVLAARKLSVGNRKLNGQFMLLLQFSFHIREFVIRGRASDSSVHGYHELVLKALRDASSRASRSYMTSDSRALWHPLPYVASGTGSITRR
jgi:hypothetical protein